MAIGGTVICRLWVYLTLRGNLLVWACAGPLHTRTDSGDPTAAAAAVCEDEKRCSDVWKTPSAWHDLTRYSFEKPALNKEYGGPSYKVFEKS